MNHTHVQKVKVKGHMVHNRVEMDGWNWLHDRIRLCHRTSELTIAKFIHHTRYHDSRQLLLDKLLDVSHKSHNSCIYSAYSVFTQLRKQSALCKMSSQATLANDRRIHKLAEHHEKQLAMKNQFCLQLLDVYLVVVVFAAESFLLNARHIQHVGLRHGFLQTTECLLATERQWDERVHVAFRCVTRWELQLLQPFYNRPFVQDYPGESVPEG